MKGSKIFYPLNINTVYSRLSYISREKLLNSSLPWLIFDGIQARMIPSGLADFERKRQVFSKDVLSVSSRKQRSSGKILFQKAIRLFFISRGSPN